MRHLRVFGLLFIGVALMTLTGCTGNDPDTNVSELMDSIDSFPYSRLDAEGLQQIEDTRIIKFDLHSGTVRLSDVGFDADDALAIGDPRAPEKLLVLDGPHCREVLRTRTLFITADRFAGTLDDIAFWRSVDTLDDAITEVRDGIDRFGYNKDNVEEWVKGVTKHRDDEYRQVISTGVGRCGLITSVEVNYKKDRPVVLQYFVYIQAADYDPANLESIRTTGRALAQLPPTARK